MLFSVLALIITFSTVILPKASISNEILDLINFMVHPKNTARFNTLKFFTLLSINLIKKFLNNYLYADQANQILIQATISYIGA